MIVSTYRAKFKAFLRSKCPWLYPFVYKVYVGTTNKVIDKKRVDKYAHFVKRGFYPFKLGSVQFDILLDPNNGGIDMEIFTDGVYEPEILKLLGSNLKAGDIFIDIGANIGQHSMFCSYFCKQVYSFEPVKKLFDQFNESIAKNEIHNITSYNYALGDADGEIPMYSNGSSMATSSIVSTTGKHFIQNVEVVKLDDVYKKLGIDGASLVKVDVEGYEFNVLKGAENFLKKYKPKIVIEFSPYFYRRTDPSISQKIIDFLTGLGYELYDLDDVNSVRRQINNLEDISNKDQVNLLCIQS